jgi:hypothetical protein
MLLMRSVDVRGQVGRAGLNSRPAVPSLVRSKCRRGVALGVVEELVVDGSEIGRLRHLIARSGFLPSAGLRR